MTRFTGSSKKAAANKPKKNAREKAQLKEQDFLGLCDICMRAKTCAFRKDVSQAVLECDEFNIGQAVELTADVTSAVVESKPDSRVQFKGLCVNCDIHYNCASPKPAEGVWHCEEYV